MTNIDKIMKDKERHVLTKHQIKNTDQDGGQTLSTLSSICY